MILGESGISILINCIGTPWQLAVVSKIGPTRRRLPSRFSCLGANTVALYRLLSSFPASQGIPRPILSILLLANIYKFEEEPGVWYVEEETNLVDTAGKCGPLRRATHLLHVESSSILLNPPAKEKPVEGIHDSKLSRDV
ncbi:hypothetical protein HZH66_007576 [Vespula vulgaris]|uniref:Uncharacterized protein n=1 Tax=Vespula vulgaris TaxID=7454 RepID=A0A834JXX4_VESVU|nr:hypothetical protein HZH66_007576 [Vespula vulgaris]